jgi:ribulose-phosphate 3-epimerase
MKGQLAPSILSFDLGTLASTLPRVMNAGAHIVHLDVMDGQFVPPISFGAAMAQSVRRCTPAPMEAHLMTLTPEAHFDAFIEAGCKRIIFHAEATAHAHRLIQSLKEKGIEAGMAINPGTPAEVLKPVIQDMDMALVMTVNPGWGGQKFIGSTLEKIKLIRSWRADLDIQVDGGIDPTTLPIVRAAGANVFVVGSYLLKPPTLEQGVKEILDLCG